MLTLLSENWRVTPIDLKLLMVSDAGLDLQLLTTHVQLKLTGSPPVQRSAARRVRTSKSDAGLDLQLLTTHVQLKLTGSPPV